MKHILFLALGFLTLNSFALSESECTTINILNAPNVPAEVREHFNHPFNQYGSQLCYSHAAADILSVFSGRSISPVALAISAAGSEFDPYSAGEVVNLFDFVNSSHSACSNAGYNSRMREEQYQSLPSRINCTSANSVSLNKQINTKFYRDCLSGQIPRRVLPEAYKDQILSAIYQEISTHHYPVAVSVYSSLLIPLKPGDEPEMSGAHIMSVIGRKWNSEKNTCDIVFRNSYGDESCGDWDQTKEGLTCDSASLGNGFPSSGTFAVSEALFKQILHRVTMVNHAENPAETVTVITPPDICRPDPNASR